MVISRRTHNGNSAAFPSNACALSTHLPPARSITRYALALIKLLTHPKYKTTTTTNREPFVLSFLPVAKFRMSAVLYFLLTLIPPQTQNKNTTSSKTLSSRSSLCLSAPTVCFAVAASLLPPAKWTLCDVSGAVTALALATARWPKMRRYVNE